jgi:4-hydroxy-tetrahydrodipicolinate synthase
MTALLNASAKGVYTISATPFAESGEIDWASVDTLIEFYLRCGVAGLTILGMMGEAQKLSDEESVQFTRHYLRRVDGRVPVIVGVSNPGTANLVKLSRAAMDAGACGVMIAPLTGLKTESAIVAYFDQVIAALGADVPVVYQDYPQSTQADISVESFLKIVDSHPSVVMFKHEDCPGLKKLSQLRQACDGSARRYVSILVGNGGLYVPQELARGADGIMTGFAYPEMLVEVCSLFAAGKANEA